MRRKGYRKNNDFSRPFREKSVKIFWDYYSILFLQNQLIVGGIFFLQVHGKIISAFL